MRHFDILPALHKRWVSFTRFREKLHVGKSALKQTYGLGGLHVNLDKTKIISFTSSGKLLNGNQFIFKGARIELVKEYIVI